MCTLFSVGEYIVFSWGIHCFQLGSTLFSVGEYIVFSWGVGLLLRMTGTKTKKINKCSANQNQPSRTCKLDTLTCLVGHSRDSMKSTCDCVIQVRTTHIRAHKYILTPFSGYFSGLFRFEQPGGDIHRQMSPRNIELNHLNAQAVEALIGGAYRGELTVSLRGVQALLEAADYLCIDSVVQFCCEYISDLLTTNNCLSILRCAMLFNKPELINNAMSFVLDKFYEVAATQKFLQLDSQVLTTLLKDDKLVMKEKFSYSYSTTSYFVEPSRQEELLLKVVLRYVWFNKPQRMRLLPELLNEGVRLPLMPTSVLLKYRSNSLIADCSQCLRIIDQHIEFQRLQSVTSSSQCRMRHGDDVYTSHTSRQDDNEVTTKTSSEINLSHQNSNKKTTRNNLSCKSKIRFSNFLFYVAKVCIIFSCNMYYQHRC